MLPAEFDPWAPYYDWIHQGLPGEVDFYAAEAANSGREILELGCGTGRISIPIALAGIPVTGIDLSKNMLTLCRAKAEAAGLPPGILTLHQADMRDFSLDKRFSLATMPYRTFMHLLTPEDQVHCLSCIWRHLLPGGLLALNLWAAKPSSVVRAAKYHPEPEETARRYTIEGEDNQWVHYHTAAYDEFRQRIDEHHRIIEEDKEGRTICTEELTLTRTWLTPREMEHLACRCGFTVASVWGDFNGGALGPESTEMVWRLRKTHQ